ncbi:RDD family protein [Cutibacterium sp. V947]|uniref:RDD family protein n=1 Tax=unclassified Cutibacterium TaxID=2649671 RepID=UPI003EDFFEE0
MSGIEAAPGTPIGLPAEGCGSPASRDERIGALIVGLGASVVLAGSIVGQTVIRGGDWPMWMPMAVFCLEFLFFTTMAGGSFGQIVARMAGVPLGALGLIRGRRAIVHTSMTSLVVPTLVIRAERRGPDDLVHGTVVVDRK